MHTLTGVYAVNALPDSEREEFARHLAACPSCEREVAELRATAGRLGLAVSAATSPRMRERVLREIAHVRQEPPRVGGPAGGPAADARHGEADARHGEADARHGEAGGGTASEARSGYRGKRRGGGRSERPRGGPRSGLRALPRFALAACLALAAASGGVAVWQYRAAQDAHEQAERSQRQQQELARVLAAPDARTTGRGELPGGASGTVVVSRDRDRAAFLTSGLDAPPRGKVYQLWFADGKKMRSAGLMESAGGSEAVLMEGNVGRASAMGVTVEPAGGSPQPTTQPLALMKLPRA
nr:anti-sigma factor [Streptomyces sp. HNM0575]